MMQSSRTFFASEHLVNATHNSIYRTKSLETLIFRGFVRLEGSCGLLRLAAWHDGHEAETIGGGIRAEQNDVDSSPTLLIYGHVHAWNCGRCVTVCNWGASPRNAVVR